MSAAYTALLSSEDGEDIDDAEYLNLKEEKKDTPSLWIFASLAFAVFGIVLNLFTPARVQGALYRPNMYIGLENINSTMMRMSLPSRLTVFPHTFAPVSSLEPSRVFPTDGNARITFNGLVSPGEPHVIINKHTSMVAQHRVQDYGLSRCAIVSTIPEPSLLTSQNRTLTLAASDFGLDVWLLDSSARLDVRTLSWNTRPSRTKKVGSIIVRQGEETFSSEFDCGEPGSIRTYEFACQDRWQSNCEIEFIQGQPETKPRMAITIEQRPSRVSGLIDFVTS